MSRTAASNTWEEGLIMDLNPISTPNTVLTDCINGTFITYNGNEFSLQNDQGNYKLEYCRLTPNYIPVGIKEYGDILYIVSQNPLDNSVEIGSYPSPLMISTPDLNETQNEIQSIIKSQILDKDLLENTYTELTENATNIVFTGDNNKLNPGDEYCLQTNGEKFPYKYETVEYHILDDDSNIHNITDKIVLDSNGEIKDFQHVSWTIPGWLSVKSRLAELSIAGINIKSFYVPKNTDVRTAHFAFNLRLNINDEYLTKKTNGVSILDSWCSQMANHDLTDVRFRVFIEKETNGEYVSVYDSEFVEFGITENPQSIPENLYLNEYDWTEWYGDSKILWRNISGKITELDDIEKVRVRMIPVLYEEKYGYKIVYDNLEQNILFDLTSAEDQEWNLGTELYQFYVNNDKSSQCIYTNISGPMISTFPVNLHGYVYDFNGNLVKEIAFEDYSGIGENVLQIPFDSQFRPENIYIIQFRFAPSAKEIGNFPTVTRFLITSEIFNDFTNVVMYDRDIKFEEWVSKYWNHSKADFSFTYEPLDLATRTPFDEFTSSNESGLTDNDKKYFAGEKYNTFFPNENPNLSETISYRKGYDYICNYDLKIDVNLLHGDLWDGFEPSFSLQKLDHKTNTKVDFDTSVNETYVQAFVETLCKYTKLGVPFEFTNADIWYFSDNLSILNNQSNSGKLIDYVYDVLIEVFGSNANSSQRTFKVSSDLKRSGESVGSKYRFSRTTSGVGKFSVYDIKDHIYNAMVDNKLPCMLVKNKYILTGESTNYQLFQTIMGGPNSGEFGNFVFHETEDTTLIRYYLCFIDKEHKVPVLIPFIDGDRGEECFKTFCNKMSVLTKPTYLSQYDRYILNKESENHVNPRLTIYNKGIFKSMTYLNYDLQNFNVRKELLSKFPDIKYNSIFIDMSDLNSVMTGDSIIFDEMLADVKFKSSEYPYVTIDNMVGINDIDNTLIKLASTSEEDFSKWCNSPQLNDERSSTELKGLYCDELYSSNDPFLIQLNDGYLENGDSIIYLTSKPIDFNDGITQHIANDWSGVISWDYTWNEFKELSKERAMWFFEHNYDSGNYNSSLSSNSFLIFGGCLESDPDMRLDNTWNWIKQ